MSTQDYRAIFNHIAVAAIIVDADMKIILVNHEFMRLSGYSKAQIKSTPCLKQMIVDEDQDRLCVFFSDIRKSQSEESQYFGETLIKSKSQGLKNILIYATILREGDEAVLSLVDITDRKKAQEINRKQQKQLIQADKMATLGILVSGIAHEISNPNNYILLNGRIINRVWSDAYPILEKYYKGHGDFSFGGMMYSQAREKIGPIIQGIPEGAQRIQNIVHSLKDFARHDSGRMNQNVDINAVMESAIVITRNLINRSTKHFKVDYDRYIPSIRGNFQQLEQVIINLITNACQALPDTSRAISLSSELDRDSGSVQLIVTDEGIGMTPDEQRHIFDPFFTTKRDEGGTGLGLSICYTIIKDHEGTIKIETEPGKGTQITIALPVNRE